MSTLDPSLPLTPVPVAPHEESWQLTNVSSNDLELALTPGSPPQRAVVFNRRQRRFSLLPGDQHIVCPLCRRSFDSPQPHQEHSEEAQEDAEDEAHFEELPPTPNLSPRRSDRQHSSRPVNPLRHPKQHLRLQGRTSPNRLLHAPSQSGHLIPAIYRPNPYFDLLSESVQASPSTSRASSFSHSDRTHWQEDSSQDHHIDPNSFVQGYYSRFFIEERKLGRGQRGVVFLCEHVLEGNRLGQYAVKKISVGDSTQSLLTTLREVKHLERLRHPSIISYHHAWIERASTSAFSPLVPHLYLLMSYCNGGSLHSYINQRKSLIERESGDFQQTGHSNQQPNDQAAEKNEKLKQAFKARKANNANTPQPAEMNA